MSKEETPKVVRVTTLAILSDRERAAYDQYVSAKEPPLAPSTQAGFFELFLNGVPLTEIARLNKPHKLGAIAMAAVEGDWYGKRLDYVDSLLKSIAPRVLQTQSESVSFVTDLLAAAHKVHGEKLRKFIQTGDESLLGDFSLKSLDSYRKAVEMLLKLTGQDKPNTPLPAASTKTVAQTSTPAKPMLTDGDTEDLLAALQGGTLKVKTKTEPTDE